jgi:hypothetical protein
MEKRELRPLVLDFVRRVPHTHLHAVIAHVKEAAPDYERHDALKVHEVLWDLLLQGVLAPGKDSLNLSLPFVHVTEEGLLSLEEETLLHDPDGYLDTLAERAGGPLDEAALVYVRESVLSFLAGRDRACVDLLALASERVLDLLVEAQARTLRTARERAAFVGRIARAGRSAEARASVLREALADVRLPAPAAAALDRDIPGLLAFLRYARDEAGAPCPRPVDRETAHANLLLFPGHCAGISALLAALSTREG